MSKLSTAAAAVLVAVAAGLALSGTASAGMYVPPTYPPLVKPKPVAQPPKVVAPPNIGGGRPTHGYYRPPVVVRPPSTQLPGGVTVITKPRR